MVLAVSYIAAMKLSGASIAKFGLSPVNPAIAFAMLLGFYPG